MNLDDQKWFSEVHQDGGSAFSLSITAKLHEEQTPYQTLAVYDTSHYGKLMTLDGLVMLSGRDNFLYHEMMAHPALFAHPQPRKVVIVGGGDCGTLFEVLKHDCVEHALQVEIDERVTRVSEQYFPDLCASNQDPRAEFLFGDGIRWMADAAAESVDVIIIDSTDPVGPAEGLFGEPFYRDCLRALRPHGILVQQTESPLYHLDTIIRPVHRAMRAAGFSATRSLQFPQPVYPSGWWSATLASKGGSLEYLREADVRGKAFKTLYYSTDMHRAAFVLPVFVAEALTQKQG